MRLALCHMEVMNAKQSAGAMRQHFERTLSSAAAVGRTREHDEALRLKTRCRFCFDVRAT